MTRKLAALSTAALGLFLSGCSLLDPREDPTRFFVLSPAGEVGPAAASDPGALIVLGPVHLPEYLLRPQVVWRMGPNQVEPSRIDRWAEPIDGALVRVLCLDLTALLPRSAVVPFPAEFGQKPALQIEIEVVAFEADPAGRVRLEGRWQVRDLQQDRRAAVHDFLLERPAGGAGTPETVAAMSALIAELSREIAAELGNGSGG